MSELSSLLFDKSEPIHYYERINIRVSDYSFPEHQVLPKMQRNKLLKQLKQDLQNKLVDSDLIFLVNNWEVQKPLDITFAFSRAVMEHVNNPHIIYKSLNNHLSHGSIMLHDIEYHSHGITKTLNGHLKISPWIWFVVVGKRRFYLNRFNMSDHIISIVSHGFLILKEDELFTNDLQKNSFGGVIVAEKVNVITTSH